MSIVKLSNATLSGDTWTTTLIIPTTRNKDQLERIKTAVGKYSLTDSNWITTATDKIRIDINSSLLGDFVSHLLRGRMKVEVNFTEVL